MSCSVRVQSGSIEPIEVMAQDMFGEPITGKTDITAVIRRISDDYFFDWDDNTFKGTPTQLTQPLVEVSSDLAPGVYKLHAPPLHVRGFNTAAINNLTDDETYQVIVDQTGGTDVANLPQIGEIKVGQYVDNIPDFSVNERDEIKKVLGITGTGTPDDSPSQGVLSIILGLVQQNFFMDNTVYSSGGLLTSGRIRIFPSKSLTDAATDGGNGQGELATFRIVAVPKVSPLEHHPHTYKVTRES